MNKIKLLFVFIFLSINITSAPPVFCCDEATTTINIDANYLELSLEEIILLQLIILYLSDKINTYMGNNVLFIINMGMFVYFLTNFGIGNHIIYLTAIVASLSLMLMNIEKRKEYKKQKS